MLKQVAQKSYQNYILGTLKICLALAKQTYMASDLQKFHPT